MGLKIVSIEQVHQDKEEPPSCSTSSQNNLKGNCRNVNKNQIEQPKLLGAPKVAPRLLRGSMTWKVFPIRGKLGVLPPNMLMSHNSLLSGESLGVKPKLRTKQKQLLLDHDFHIRGLRQTPWITFAHSHNLNAKWRNSIYIVIPGLTCQLVFGVIALKTSKKPLLALWNHHNICS